MEVYEESPTTKGHKQLDHSLANLDMVTLESPRRAAVDSGSTKRTQDKMGSPEQWVFAYLHNVFDVDNFDKVDGHNHYDMIDGDRFEYTVAHYMQSFVSQVLCKLVGITVVDIAPAMVLKPFVVAQYWILNQDEG